MLILLIIIIIISLMLFTTKIKNRSAIWMALILCGWFLSMSGLVLYIAKYSGFYYRVNFVLFLNDSFRRFLLDLPISINSISRLITVGRSIFIYSLLGFAISLDYKRGIMELKIPLLLNLIFPLINIVIYDPIIYKNFIILMSPAHIYILSLLTRIWLVISVTISYIIMLLQLRAISVPWVKNKIKSFLPGLISLTAFYFYLGFMGPLQVTDIRTLYFLYSDFTNFNPPLSLLEWYVSIILTTITTLISIFSLWKYTDVEKKLGKSDLQLERKFKTANMGVRVFTHALKNQTLMIQVLLNQTKEQLLSSQSDPNEKIIQNIDNISHIVSNLIDRMDQLYSSFKSSTIQLKAVQVKEIIERALVRIPYIPINVKINTEIVSNVTILADVHHFPEVIFNIIINGIEAISPQIDGKISLCVTTEDKWCIFEISDNGSGIPESQLECIFDPFYTSKNTNKNWGVGLSFCKQTVISHFGRINVVSNVGKGSTFRIFIPIYSIHTQSNIKNIFS